MRKLLAARDPAPALAAMAQAGVLGRILPCAYALGLAPLVNLEGDRAPFWLRRLALIGGEDAAARLRLSRAEAQDLAALCAAAGGMETPAAIGWRLGAERGWDAVAIRAVQTGAPLPGNVLRDLARGASADLPVRAEDLMPGLQGPALGARLKAIEADWLASDLRKTRAQLLG
jgi:poly(A) polymerase